MGKSYKRNSEYRAPSHRTESHYREQAIELLDAHGSDYTEYEVWEIATQLQEDQALAAE